MNEFIISEETEQQEIGALNHSIVQARACHQLKTRNFQTAGQRIDLNVGRTRFALSDLHERKSISSKINDLSFSIDDTP